MMPSLFVSHGGPVIGSGAMTHDARHMTAHHDATECPRAAGFAAWMGQALAGGDIERLLAWEEGPGACTSHSTAEHLWPLYVALGAAEGPGTCLHASVQRATMAMQVWRFDGAHRGSTHDGCSLEHDHLALNRTAIRKVMDVLAKGSARP